MSEYRTEELEYQEQVDGLRLNCMEYPAFVTIETLTLCNAACGFCPYSTLERKGDKMPTEVFEKIINDLKDIPVSHGFSMHLSRVNEPFLDSRIFDFYQMINEHLPQVQVSFFSNASVLSEDKILKIAEIKNVEFFVISLNDHRKSEYEKTMKISYDKTIKHLDNLYRHHQKETIKFPILISRVGDGTLADREFVAWCEQRYPEFIVSVRPRGDWMGMTQAANFEIPNVGCRQWFQLHFLSDGRESFCCIDAEGKFGSNRNVKFDHVLDIYNAPERVAVRKSLRSRKELDLCANCAMFA
jgi:hypothetical protein